MSQNKIIEYTCEMACFVDILGGISDYPPKYRLYMVFIGFRHKFWKTPFEIPYHFLHYENSRNVGAGDIFFEGTKISIFNKRRAKSTGIPSD